MGILPSNPLSADIDWQKVAETLGVTIHDPAQSLFAHGDSENSDSYPAFADSGWPTGNKNVVDIIGDGVRVTREPPVIVEQHHGAVRYPDALMPETGIGVEGFAVTLDLKHTGYPEAGAIGRAVHQEIMDLIQNVIRGRDLYRTWLDGYASHTAKD